MQRCPVFKGLFEVARRMYLLFQHHTTAADAVRRRAFISDTCVADLWPVQPKLFRISVALLLK